MAETYTVIAWKEISMEWDGELFSADLGERPNFIPKQKAKALVWRAGGNFQQDAQDYISKVMVNDEDKINPTVFVLKTDDPLGEAKRRILG